MIDEMFTSKIFYERLTISVVGASEEAGGNACLMFNCCLKWIIMGDDDDDDKAEETDDASHACNFCATELLGFECTAIFTV